ncbi:MAG: energy transducer TonB [Magnetococcales bacterium]|nr:energy transducer TonB [Magnetococcales bacterium]
MVQTDFGWQVDFQKVLLGKIITLAVALALHVSLVLPLLIKPDYIPPAPISTSSFEFVNLPSKSNNTKTEVKNEVKATSKPEAALVPTEINKPAPAVLPKTAAKTAIPVTKKTLPTPQSQPKLKPAKKENLAKKVVAKPDIKKATPQPGIAKTTSKQVSTVTKQPSAFTPPIGKVSTLNNPKPIYPIIARRRGLEGLVLLSVDVDSEGFPLGVRVKKGSGHKVLDRCAMQTVKKWRFIPAKMGSVTVRASVEVPIRFSLLNS